MNEDSRLQRVVKKKTGQYEKTIYEFIVLDHTNSNWADEPDEQATSDDTRKPSEEENQSKNLRIYLFSITVFLLFVPRIISAAFNLPITSNIGPLLTSGELIIDASLLLFSATIAELIDERYTQKQKRLIIVLFVISLFSMVIGTAQYYDAEFGKNGFHWSLITIFSIFAGWTMVCLPYKREKRKDK